MRDSLDSPDNERGRLSHTPTNQYSAVKEERARELLRTLLDRYRSYHDHKESMAYAGLTLCLAAFGAALLANEWPPQWMLNNKGIVALAISVVWLFALVFVKWELVRRRWAALRCAGIERLLAKWTCNDVAPDDLDAWSQGQKEKVKGKWSRVRASIRLAGIVVIDHIFPLAAAKPAVDIAESVYPTGLVNEWHAQQGRGTGALFHERLLVLAGWLVYLALLLRTLLVDAMPTAPFIGI